MIRFELALKAQVTWRSGPNAHGPHSCYTVFSVPAYTFGLRKNSLRLVARERELLGLVYWCFCMIGRHHLKVDNFSTAILFWDIHEEQWWRGILPMDSTSRQLPRCSLCLEGEVVSHEIIYWFMTCGQCLAGWSGIWKEHVWKTGDKEM